jgi:hypothetical protein
VEFVEGIHRALLLSRPVALAIAELRDATLGGIVEYACLKWAMNGQVPSLPTHIVESDLSRRLSAAATDFALGEPAGRLRMDTLEIRPIEFLSLRDQAHVASTEVELFEIRFNRSAQSVGISPSVSDQLQVALHEMLENAVIHSEAAVSPIAGYAVGEGRAHFCVADVGIGVLKSLRQCGDFGHLRLHTHAIRTALHDGNSRFGKQRGGFGFREVFKALAAQWGDLRFRSGEGCISMNGQDLNADVGTERFPPSLPGFQVSVVCRAAGSAILEPVI